MDNSQEPNDDKKQSSDLSGKITVETDSTKIEGDPTKIHLKKNPGEILMGILAFIKNRLSLRHDHINYREVVENTKAGVTFKGYNVWILMCSIVVASVGLNVNSPAVIIGAMLISPLMGPIRGVGFGVAQNDFKLLIDSIKNLGITVGISVFVSFLYFVFSPIHETTSELLGRTSPTFLDVIIAFFGGLAGIIAAAKGKNDTVIPGVAIATALMPPLCTVGYGLAIGNMSYFLGAFYLFLLNSLLIALSTFLIMKYLRFPIKEYVNPKVERKVKMYIISFLIIIIAPSAYLFYKMSKRSIFERNGQQFFTEVVMKDAENMLIAPEYQFDFDDSKIILYVQAGYVGTDNIANWESQLKYFELSYCDMDVVQGEDLKSYLSEQISSMDNGSSAVSEEIMTSLKEKDDEIKSLKTEINYYQDYATQLTHGLDMNYLLEGYRIDYPEIEELSINRSYSVRDEGLDTTYNLFTNFRENTKIDLQKDIMTKLSQKFLFELKSKKLSKQDTVIVHSH